MSERALNLGGGLMALGGLSYSKWQPILEGIAGGLTPLITIVGALTALVVLANYIVTLRRNILALREEQEAAHDHP